MRVAIIKPVSNLKVAIEASSEENHCFPAILLCTHNIRTLYGEQTECNSIIVVFVRLTNKSSWRVQVV